MKMTGNKNINNDIMISLAGANPHVEMLSATEKEELKERIREEIEKYNGKQ